MRDLQAPFNLSDIRWRVTNTSKDRKKGQAVAYVSNRAIQTRLDEVFGVNGWRNEFKEWHSNKTPINPKDLLEIMEDTLYTSGDYKGKVKTTAKKNALNFLKNHYRQSQICGISVWDEDKSQWITKWDGADETNFEETKGGLSDSMKRAASEWGIGRYLYDLEATWVELTQYGKIKKNPDLPSWACQENAVSKDMINSLADRAMKKGMPEHRLCAAYYKESYGQLSTEEYKRIMVRLEEYKNVPLGSDPELKEGDNS